MVMKMMTLARRRSPMGSGQRTAARLLPNRAQSEVSERRYDGTERRFQLLLSALRAGAA
jgi:hypothetical protein